MHLVQSQYHMTVLFRTHIGRFNFYGIMHINRKREGYFWPGKYLLMEEALFENYRDYQEK